MSSSALSYQDGNELEPKELIPQLCRLFYGLGWVTGSGGGISIRKGDQIFIAPSGVQKECIQPEDLFIQNIEGEDLLVPPPSKKLKKSQCTPLFMCAYRLRNAQAVIHSHSKSAVLATLISAENEFRCTHLEMIKGIYDAKLGRNLNYNETLVVPIVENTPFEADLETSLTAAMEKYPGTSAVLVRRHGFYVWGNSWQQAKVMAECYDYLFDIAVQMKQLGQDASIAPEDKSNGHE
ncbi:Hypothetical predicted protein [Cloeon dipterum]|uniref:Probable methylthioribulose-1-phosphate dehydratase n=1 Tax=Cloeon dipterum TaxID=197152 RepID=A0A8S1DDV1_9INSE|nr:Hypothetical predicted protein [Cloeon dipterum]